MSTRIMYPAEIKEKAIKVRCIHLMNIISAVKRKTLSASMSRKGTPTDNAPIEYFHSSLKCETLYHKTAYKYAKSIVIQIVKDYIKYYNEKRIQQKLGYQSPINFRKQAA